MSVERVVDRKPSAVTWWIDNPVIEETARRKAKTESASPRRTDGYLHLMRVFDELILKPGSKRRQHIVGERSERCG